MCTQTSKTQFKKMFIFGWDFIAVCKLSLVAVSGGSFLDVVHELLIAVASLVAEHGLLRAGSVVVARGTRDRNHVLCIARRILNHWTTREVP